MINHKDKKKCIVFNMKVEQMEHHLFEMMTKGKLDVVVRIVMNLHGVNLHVASAVLMKKV